MVNFDQSKKIRTRFAPSPTGFVHIGNFRTALFSHLWAKHNGGTSVLRIEDTDQNRKVEGAIEYLLRVMKQMDIEFDEGFYLKADGKIGERGDFGPYLQSQRLNLYQQYADQLLKQGQAYYCFCSEQRLEDLRKEQTALKKPPMYDRHCKNLSADEIKKQLDEFKTSGKNPVIRFFIPEGQTVVHDLIYGDITYENKILDDQVIIKSDGFPTYHLAVVVDDHLMQISHVIRGEEWIPSTPKHLLIYKALGWEPTQFAHLPLILNPDKSKLSKRQGDVATEDYLKKGYLPEVLINFVAMLGWNPKTEQEIFSFDDLVKQFDLSKVNKSGAVFDINKLDWISGQYIKKMPVDELTERLLPYWEQDSIKAKDFDKKYLSTIADLEKERLKKLSEIGERTRYFFETPEYAAELLIWKKSDREKTRQALLDLVELFTQADESKFSKEEIENLVKKMIADKGYDNGSVLWPLRASLTGQQFSPGPFEVCATLALGLGKEEVLKRLNTAVSKLD
jgi:glutamyl-tRNA synthetase